jgi:hypothetical protein
VRQPLNAHPLRARPRSGPPPPAAPLQADLAVPLAALQASVPTVSLIAPKSTAAKVSLGKGALPSLPSLASLPVKITTTPVKATAAAPLKVSLPNPLKLAPTVKIGKGLKQLSINAAPLKGSLPSLPTIKVASAPVKAAAAAPLNLPSLPVKITAAPVKAPTVPLNLGLNSPLNIAPLSLSAPKIAPLSLSAPKISIGKGLKQVDVAAKVEGATASIKAELEVRCRAASAAALGPWGCCTATLPLPDSEDPRSSVRALPNIRARRAPLHPLPPSL